ncbi:MAG: outer membrane protein assembly factor BamD [Planctomycetota bacterium]|jgi:outer membrane assembly lipoprotein YfiO
METPDLARFCLVLVLVAALAAAVPGSLAMEIWTPETGEVDLEEQPRDSDQARRRHALALMGAGQWAGGLAQLRALIAAEPDAEWVPGARFAIARALLAAGRPREAFDECRELGASYADAPFAGRARGLQFTAARLAAGEDPFAAEGLYDWLRDTASTQQEAARAQKAKADAFFRERLYLEAEFHYRVFIEDFPRSEWVSYCSFRIAECKWETARWLRLGLEDLGVAERDFRYFVRRYPGDPLTEEAEQKAADARRDRAALNWDIARFYIEDAGRPWAAVSYLEALAEEFPGTSEAEQAEQELARIRQESPTARMGGDRELELPGVVSVQSGE